jgi:hypothetical protein
MRACPSSRYGFVRWGENFGDGAGPLTLDGVKISGPGQPGAAGYCVVTATLVAPRGTPPPSVMRPNTRLFFASNGMAVLELAKTAKVGVWPAPIVVVTVGVGKARQAPVDGLVSQTLRVTGTLTPPVSAENEMAPADPTFDVAIAKAPAPPTR